MKRRGRQPPPVDELAARRAALARVERDDRAVDALLSDLLQLARWFAAEPRRIAVVVAAGVALGAVLQGARERKQ